MLEPFQSSNAYAWVPYQWITPMKYTNELKRFLSEYERYEQQILKPTYDEIKKLFSRSHALGTVIFNGGRGEHK